MPAQRVKDVNEDSPRGPDRRLPQAPEDQVSEALTRSFWSFLSSRCHVASISLLSRRRALDWLQRQSCGEKNGQGAAASFTGSICGVPGAPMGRDSKVNRAVLVLQTSPGDHRPPEVQGRRSPGWQQLVGTGGRRGKGQGEAAETGGAYSGSGEGLCVPHAPGPSLRWPRGPVTMPSFPGAGDPQEGLAQGNNMVYGVFWQTGGCLERRDTGGAFEAERVWARTAGAIIGVAAGVRPSPRLKSCFREDHL